MVDSIVANAEAAQSQGRLPEAESFARRALAEDPENVRANVVLAMVEARTGRIDSAVARFLQVQAVDPDCFEAALWLSMLYRRTGAHPASAEHAARAVRLRPQEAQVHSNLGLSYMAAHDLVRATESFQRADRLNPQLAPNLHQLGMALQLQGRDAEAADAFRRALALNPNALETILCLGQSLMSDNDFTGAIDCARRVLALQPNSATAHLLLAGALIEENRSSEAEPHIQRAIDLGPAESNAHAMLGMRMQSLGRLDEANAAFLRSIEIQPKQGFAYCALIRNQKVSGAHRELLAQMEGLVESDAVGARGQSYLRYGLGKAYEDLRDYERALAHFDEANRLAYRLKFGERTFDRRAFAKTVDWIIATFTPDFFDKYRSAGLASDAPIFILGMMRSGTTLAEQILSSHPDVEATGEQHFWTLHAAEALAPGMSALDAPRLQDLAGRYLRTLKQIAPAAPRQTDKMPGNYVVLGAIYAAFPNAKIVHTHRSPRDTCISIYTTPNRAPKEWAHNRENIVFAYEQYVRLMDHWRKVLPANRLLEVPYEEVVADRERQTRRMVAFCGLEWNEACLRPEDNERTVVTPSVWQVRQPVYNTSVARWRNYEPWLGAFARLTH